MKNRKTILSILLTLAIVIIFMPFATIPAYAATANELVNTINGFNFGGTGSITATASGNTVTVTGSVTGATGSMQINIDPNVTVVWKATLTSTSANHLIRLYRPTTSTGGTFEVDGGTISATGGHGIEVNGPGYTVNVQSGTVTSAQRSGIHLTANSVNCTINVTGGTISSTSTVLNPLQLRAAICSEGRNTRVMVAGGTVSSVVDSAIFVSIDGIVEVNGGVVRNNTTATSYGVIQFPVSSSGNTSATVSGTGRVEALGSGSAIAYPAGVFVSGGEVRATTGYGIRVETGGIVSVTGGLVYAYGDKIYGTSNCAIYMPAGGTPTITAPGIAIAWDREAASHNYIVGETKNISVSPSNATAVWAVPNLISYSSGTNSGSITVSQANVTVPVPVPQYTVTFVDWDGAVLKTETVNQGSAAAAPANPVREDYTFTGWNAAFDNITSDLTVTAQYRQSTFYSQSIGGTTRFFDALAAAVPGDTYVINTPSINAYSAVVQSVYVPEGVTLRIDSGRVLMTSFSSSNNNPIANMVGMVNDGTVIINGVFYAIGDFTNNGTIINNSERDMNFRYYNDFINNGTIVGRAPLRYVYVRFVDWDGRFLEIRDITYGGTVTPNTTNVIREGYTFTGWDKVLTNVTDHLAVTAQYELNLPEYTVTFVNWDEIVIAVRTVKHGFAASAPVDPERDGCFAFAGWDADFDVITENMTVTALYEISHNFGEGIITPPTCTDGGFTTYTCMKCNYSYIEDETAMQPCGECGICKTDLTIIGVTGARFVEIAETSKNSREWRLTLKVTVIKSDGSGEDVQYSIILKGNNANLNGKYVFEAGHDLAGYTLTYDIKGNGSNIKAFIIN